MATKAATFCIFLTYLAISNCRPQEGPFDCSGKVDGPHADLQNPRKFYVCFDEVLMVSAECEEGEIFQGNGKTCVSTSSSGNEQDEAKELAKYSGNGEEAVDISNLLKEDGTPVWEDDRPRGKSKYKVYNVRVTENVFPQSVLVIKKANTEQKNK